MNLRVAAASTLVAAVAMAAPALGAGQTKTSASKGQDAKVFIQDAIRGDNSEVVLGDLAQQKAQNQSVKEYGKVISTDHAQNKTKAMSLAQSIGAKPSDQPTAEAEKEKTKLEKLKGDAFDREFVNYMITDHKKNIGEFTQASKDTANPQVAQYAKETLPDLNKHLADAQSLQSKMTTAKK